MRPRMASAELNKIKELYEGGMKCSEIAKIIGRDQETVRRNLKKMNVQMRQYRDYHAEEVDEQYFNIIDSADKAYWFGFLAADGCVSESCGDYRAFHFNLQRSDRKSIEDFVAAVKYSGKIRDFEHYHKKNDKIYLKSGVDFNNKTFCQALLNKGWLAFKKDDNPDMLSHVPDSYIKDFIRGFFDGDGCISRRKKKFKSFYFSFSGSKNVLNYIGRIISSELGFKSKLAKKSKRCNSYRIGWNGNKQVRKFGDWLYKDVSVWMDRKKCRFDMLSGFVLPEYIIDSSNNFYYPLSYNEIAKLPQEHRDLLVAQFEAKISKCSWIAPSYGVEELNEDYSRLMAESLSDYTVDDGFRSWNVSSLGFAGRKILTHFQPHYWETSYRTQKTLVEGWSEPKIRSKACGKLFNTRGARPSLQRYLRELNVSGARRVSHFHPGLAKAAILYFGGGNVKSMLDPCAGWGARLLACSSLGVRYTSCDPNHKTVGGLSEMSKFIGFHCNIFNIPFEEYEPDRRFDIAFTSPPYFSVERYKYGKQSYYGKSSFKQWFDEFLLALVDKCLKCADTVVLHVSEKIRDNLLVVYPSSQMIPAFLQRTSGHARSAEWFVRIR